MYRKYLKKIIFFAIFLIPLIANSSTVFKDKFLNVQGGIILHEINKNEYIQGYKLEKKKLLTIKRRDKFYLIYGVPYSAPLNLYEINVTNSTSSTNIKVNIKEKFFEEQHITLQKKYTELSEKDIQRIGKEKNILLPYRTKWSQRDPDIDFIYPVKGSLTGVFGTKRYYNGKKGRYHNGIDIAAPINDSVVSPSSGEILLTGDFFYNGKFVYIDHGKGLLSIFIHLNKIDVKKGDFIKKGDVIGKIGTSGKSTGPHVHWSLFLNQNYIDPMIFLTTNKND